MGCGDLLFLFSRVVDRLSRLWKMARRCRSLVELVFFPLLFSPSIFTIGQHTDTFAFF